MAIKDHDKDYKPEAFREYSISELGNWVALLTMRAGMRSNKEKAAKDLNDAQNYLEMIQDVVSRERFRILNAEEKEPS